MRKITLELMFLGEGLLLSLAAVSLPGLCYRTDSALEKPDLCVSVLKCYRLAGENSMCVEHVCACVLFP